MRGTAWLGNVGAAVLLACGGARAPAGNEHEHELAIDVAGAGTGLVQLVDLPEPVGCASSCALSIAGAATVRLVALPSPGSTFDCWSDDCSGTAPCTLAMVADRRVTAVFSPAPPLTPPVLVTVSVVLTGAGAGRVTSVPPGIDCPGTCAMNVPAESSVVLAAHTDPGSRVAAWSAALGCDAASTCTILALRGTAVSIRFAPETPPSWARYSILELPPVDGIAALLPIAVNADGDVAGSYREPCPPPTCEACSCGTPPMHGFLFDAATGTARRIGDDGASTEQMVTGLNDLRQAAITTSGARQACFRWEDGTMTELGALPGTAPDGQCQTLGIAASGAIAGYVYAGGIGEHAVVWDGAAPRDLGEGLAQDLNASGQVVGWSSKLSGAGPLRAAIFDADGIRALGDASAAFPRGPRAISDLGRIVGSFDVASAGVTLVHAFVLDLPDGPMRDPLNQPSQLSSVNGSGDAAGSFLSIMGSPDGAIAWRDGALVDLTLAAGDPSWILDVATAINDRGQIVGWGRHDGQSRGFLLTPR